MTSFYIDEGSGGQSKILQRTDTCPKCDTYCLHDVLHTSWCDLCVEAGHKCGQQPSPAVEVMQCRNGACRFQWLPEDRDAHPCRCLGSGYVSSPCPDGYPACMVAHRSKCEGNPCRAVTG